MLAVRLAVPRLGDEGVAELERLVAAMAAHAERGEVTEFFEANSAFHLWLVEAAGNAKLQRALRPAARPARPVPAALADAAREPRALGRRARRDPARGQARRRRPRRAPDVRAHPRSAAQPQGPERRGARGRRSSMTLEFGVNLNNREPLIAPDYDVPMLLDLSQVVEESGFDSVWVGDSLFSKPRYEPISLLSAISQRTSQLRLGTACMVSSTRNPLYLALEWATLDVISGGRTILGTGHGQPRGGRAPRVRGARARLRQARDAVRGRARRAARSSGPRARRTSRARSSTTTTSPSTPAPRWRR